MNNIILLVTETSSLTNYQPIKISIASVNNDFTIIDRYSMYIKFEESKYEWSDMAYKHHKINKHMLETDGLTMEDSACLIIDFLLRNCDINLPLFIASYNPVFQKTNLDMIMKCVDIDLSISKQFYDTFTIGKLITGHTSFNDQSNYLQFKGDKLDKISSMFNLIHYVFKTPSN